MSAVWFLGAIWMAAELQDLLQTPVLGFPDLLYFPGPVWCPNNEIFWCSTFVFSVNALFLRLALKKQTSGTNSVENHLGLYGRLHSSLVLQPRNTRNPELAVT